MISWDWKAVLMLENGGVFWKAVPFLGRDWAITQLEHLALNRDFECMFLIPSNSMGLKFGLLKCSK